MRHFLSFGPCADNLATLENEGSRFGLPNAHDAGSESPWVILRIFAVHGDLSEVQLNPFARNTP